MTEDDKPPVDPRYAEAVKAQQEARKQMTARKRPILRLVVDNDPDDIRIGKMLEAFRL